MGCSVELAPNHRNVTDLVKGGCFADIRSVLGTGLAQVGAHADRCCVYVVVAVGW